MSEFNRDNYPQLNGPSPDAAGATLTREAFDQFHAWVTSDGYRERRRQVELERVRQLTAMNTELKSRYAASLGKTVTQLTKADMQKLNESLFRAWLKYQGVTEQEFWDWIGG